MPKSRKPSTPFNADPLHEALSKLSRDTGSQRDWASICVLRDALDTIGAGLLRTRRGMSGELVEEVRDHILRKAEEGRLRYVGVHGARSAIAYVRQIATRYRIDCLRRQERRRRYEAEQRLRVAEAVARQRATEQEERARALTERVAQRVCRALMAAGQARSARAIMLGLEHLRGVSSLEQLRLHGHLTTVLAPEQLHRARNLLDQHRRRGRRAFARALAQLCASGDIDAETADAIRVYARLPSLSGLERHRGVGNPRPEESRSVRDRRST
jgi:hypothetical protein